MWWNKQRHSQNMPSEKHWLNVIVSPKQFWPQLKIQYRKPFPAIRPFPKAFLMTSLPLTPIQLSVPYTSVQSQDSLHWGSRLQAWTSSPEVLSHIHTHTHKCLPHLADPSLYWRETLSLALKQLHCNYRHLSSVCLIYSQLKIPQKVAVGPVVCGPCD